MSQVLPFYLVCDESGSMRGVPLRAINASLPDIHSEVASNPVVADKTRFCIIGFSGSARIVLPLSDLSGVTDMPVLGYRPGGTNYSAAFRMLFDAIEDDVRKLKADGHQVYRPAVFFLSDGRPNDKNWQSAYERITDTNWPLRPNILAFGFGKASPAILQRIATVQAFIAEPGMGPAAALREFAGSLIRSIVNSASRASATSGLVLAVPDNIPGFTTLSADPILSRGGSSKSCRTLAKPPMRQSMRVELPAVSEGRQVGGIGEQQVGQRYKHQGSDGRRLGE